MTKEEFKIVEEDVESAPPAQVDIPRGLHRWLIFFAGLMAMAFFSSQADGLWMLAALITVPAILGLLYVPLAIRGVTVERLTTDGACQNDAVDVSLRVSHTGGVPAYLLEVTDEFRPALDASIRRLVPAVLSPGYRYDLRYDGYCFRKRGQYILGPTTIALSDPAGFSRRRRVEIDERLFSVFPAVVPVVGSALAGARAFFATGRAAEPRAGAGLTFLGARDYRPGDDPRDIHWPASARTARLMVKERERDVMPFLTIVMDLDARHLSGMGQKSTLELQVTMAASLAVAATQEGGYLQVVGDSKVPLRHPPGTGRLHLEAFLHRLVNLDARGSTGIARLLADAAPGLPAGSQVVVFVAGAEIDPGALSAAVERIVALPCALRAYVFDESTFLRRQEFAPRPDHVIVPAGEIARTIERRGGRTRLVSADDELERVLREAP